MIKLKQNVDLKNIYQIVGNDLFLMEKACCEIENACHNKMDELNRTIFTDENFNVDILLNVCNQIPMFAERRFILVKNITKLSEFETKKLIEYSKNPSPQCVLVFCELPEHNVFGRLKFEKIECKKLSEFELKKIIFKELEKFQIEITQDAVNLLVNFCMKDLMLIKSEIEKIKAYFGVEVKENEYLIKDKNVVDENLIIKLVHQNDEFTIFEISDSVTKSQGDRAINLLNKMLETKDFTFILGLISSHFRRMMYSTMSSGTTTEIAKKLRVKEYAIIKSRQLGSQLKITQIIKINNLILDINLKIKSGKMSVTNAMYYLVFKIIEIIKIEN